MIRPASLVIAVLLAGLVVAGCGTSDPRTRILEERAKWEVTPTSWAVDEDGRIRIGTRVQGPTTRRLDRLTVRVELHDAEGEVVRHVWKTLDLDGIDRGVPRDISIVVDGDGQAGAGIEGIAVDPVPAPTPEEESYLVELRDTP